MTSLGTIKNSDFVRLFLSAFGVLSVAGDKRKWTEVYVH